MSVQAITAALAIRDVSSAEKLLLIVLANYANEKSECWPSHSRLASDTCMSERTILRVFGTLEAAGRLTRRKRVRGKLRQTDMITLIWGGDTMSPYGDIMSQKVGTPCPQGGDTMSGKPSENPKEEPSGRKAAREKVAPPTPEERQAQLEASAALLKRLRSAA